MIFNRRCKITFICHGATIYSEEWRLSDAENYPPLSEAGVEEMERICEFLRKRGIKNDKIYASPATRTVQSADMVAKVYKKDYEILDDLHPRECGKWNGLTFQFIKENRPEDMDKMINCPDEKTPAGAEGTSAFIKRVSDVINKTVEENIGNRIIIVTHPEVIQAAICSALDVPPQKFPQLYIKTGSATQITYFEDWASLVYSGHVPV